MPSAPHIRALCGCVGAVTITPKSGLSDLRILRDLRLDLSPW